MQKIRDRITEEIQNSNMSQNEIARRIGVRQTVVWEYIHQKSLPALDTLAKLCQVLDVSADNILGLEDNYGRKTPVKTIKICNVKM